MKKDKPRTIGLDVTGKDNIFVNCDVEGFEKGIELGKTAEGNKFLNTDVIAPPSFATKGETKKWYEQFAWKLIGAAGTLLVGLLAAYLTYRFGWK